MSARSLLVMLAFLTACGGGDITAPKPARNREHKETDEWVKPGANVILKGAVTVGATGETLRVTNSDTFTWNLLDDVWLSVMAPNVKVRENGPYIGDGRHGWYVFLRCPTARIIPAGAISEMSIDACRITTYEPGSDARVVGYRIVAKEGVREAGIEPAFRLTRRQRMVE